MIISSISYKGGVGKSTVAQNIAVSLAHSGRKVCIVDADEANVTAKWSEIRRENGHQPTVQAVSLTDEKSFVSAIRKIYNDYDVIVIDSPPSYNPISAKIMLCSHIILMPIRPSGKSELWTARDLLDRYTDLQNHKGERTPAYFVVNAYRSQPSFHKVFVQALKELASEYNIGVLENFLNERIAYGEANAMGLGVIEYTNKKARSEFESLTDEIVTLAN